VGVKRSNPGVQVRIPLALDGTWSDVDVLTEDDEEYFFLALEINHTILAINLSGIQLYTECGLATQPVLTGTPGPAPFIFLVSAARLVVCHISWSTGFVESGTSRGARHMECGFSCCRRRSGGSTTATKTPRRALVGPQRHFE